MSSGGNGSGAGPAGGDSQVTVAQKTWELSNNIQAISSVDDLIYRYDRPYTPHLRRGIGRGRGHPPRPKSSGLESDYSTEELEDEDELDPADAENCLAGLKLVVQLMKDEFEKINLQNLLQYCEPRYAEL